MHDWFEKLVREAIRKALDDFFHRSAGPAEDKFRKTLARLNAGDRLPTTPLVRARSVRFAAGTLHASATGFPRRGAGGIRCDFVTAPVVRPALSP